MSNKGDYGNRTGAIYSATDKAMFDALQQYKVTRDDIKELYFTRGVIISNKTSKEILADNFSKYIHGYEDYEFLSKILGVSTQRERVKSVDLISTDITSEDIEEALDKVKEHLSVTSNDIVDYNIVGKSYSLKIEYSEPDFTKSEFRQVVDKDAEIIIEKNAQGFSLIGPHNKKMEVVTSLIFDALAEKHSSLIRDEINLEDVIDKSLVSKLFDKLTTSMEGYSLVSVTDVYVYNPDKDDGTGSHIKKASLSGTGVTLSKELGSLYKKGFYIWRIVWTVTDDRYLDSDIYEIEALFSEPETCSDFAFLVKGYYPVKVDSTDITDTHHKNRVNLSKSEEMKFNKLVLKTAKDLLEEFSKLDENSKDDEEGAI
ncbi:hypothetical protein R1H30_11640 [Escherichia coli]|jgi:hypothetical protein|uniref:hypothetical protein n=1 Tax=Escherichia coli TaxID=562 RepID=UPI000BE7E526|nr:hypothetical protein [Escherichia coli]ELF2131406.1 hypothetical protein [Salmonella enterica]HBX8372856.1 hypothetical protein [Klebsiella pneumoniae]HED0337424.1 hypothetical protein [Salmonella enterica subsp. enterica serovar Muenchen]EEV5967384.1 hypothetical protein [Escherichia coli]EFC9531345.1 hypothetical protein [Escherichia coli]